MKHLILVILAALFSLTAMADCRDVIQASLSTHRKQDAHLNYKLASVGTVSLILAGAGATPLAVILGGLVATDSGIHYVEKSNLKGLQKAVNEAYAFYDTGIAGEKLLRLKRKINRRLEQKLSTEDLVNAIMNANENESLCRSKNMHQFSKQMVIDLK